MIGLRKKHVPLRRCVACGVQRPKSQFVRIARTPDGQLDIDAAPKAAGRGAYVCRSVECLQKAAKGRPISRSLDRPLPEEDAERLRNLARELSESGPNAGP